jgi:hypothetical protein
MANACSVLSDSSSTVTEYASRSPISAIRSAATATVHCATKGSSFSAMELVLYHNDNTIYICFLLIAIFVSKHRSYKVNIINVIYNVSNDILHDIQSMLAQKKYYYVPFRLFQSLTIL